MDEVYREKIRRLTNLTKEDIGKSEEDVKINFIVPLFEALGHERLKFEHKWKDALVEKLDHLCKLVVETKNYDKNLDGELQQLERYCHEERPLLGIIANGSEIRISSYFWRFRQTFQKTLIYSINRKDFNEETIVQILWNVLSRDNLKSGKAKDYIIERENEIESAEDKIKGIEENTNNEEKNIRMKIDELTQKVEEIKSQVSNLNAELNKLIFSKNEQISRIWSDLRLPQPASREIIPPPPRSYGKSERGYRESYRRQLENPNNLISKILRYIREQGEVTYAELKSACVSQFGCKSKTSGSIGASVTILKDEGYIKIEGRGDNKRLIFIKAE